jgi:hypothetical protein
MKSCTKFVGAFIGFLAAIAGIVGLYFAYEEYQNNQKEKQANQPRVVVCLEDFTYRDNPAGGGLLSMSGSASFRLVNTGREGTTVTKVWFNPVGTWRDGRAGGISMYDGVGVNVRVEGNSVVPIRNLQFRDSAGVDPQFWVDNATHVNVWAQTPNGSEPMLQCVPSFSGWACGERDANGSVSVDTACQ